MKKFLLLTVGALLMLPGSSPSQTIIGVVVEDSTHMPIIGASVDLLMKNGRRRAAAQTDSLGAFRVSGERAGTFLLHVNHPSYMALLSDTISLRREEVVAVEVRLAPTAIALEPLIVESRMRDRLLSYRERLARGGFGRFITREEIDVRPGARATELLYAMPSVEIVRAGGGLAGPPVNLITMRGGLGRCMPTIFVDGIRVQQFNESGVDDFLTANILEGIEVYTGFAGTPPELQTMNSCGVVAFWTRSELGGKKVNGIKGGWFVAFVAVAAVVTNMIAN